MSCTIEATLFKEKIPDLSLSFPVEKQTLALFKGDYQTSEGKERSIQLDDNKLYYANGGNRYELNALSQSQFYLKDHSQIRIKFEKNGLNKVERFVMSSCWMNPEVYLIQPK